MTSSVSGSEYRAVTQILKSFVHLNKALLAFNGGESSDVQKLKKTLNDQIEEFITRFQDHGFNAQLRKALSELNTLVEGFLTEEPTVNLKSVGATVREIVDLFKGSDGVVQTAANNNSNNDVILPAGKELPAWKTFMELPDVVVSKIFGFLPLSECVRVSSVCSAWKKIVDEDPSRTLIIINRMFIKNDSATLNKNSDYTLFVKIQPEFLHFLQTRGQKITKFVLKTPDAKEATVFMKCVSARITHLTFSFTEIVEPLFADNQFWVEVLESPTLVYLNFQETKLSKMQVPVQIRDKVKEIVYPPFIYNAYACYDYNHPDPSSKEFFSFKAGDKFQIIPSVRDLQGWKIAINEQGEKGFVPGNYLVMLDKK